jgi:hypothetical protein
MGTMATPKSGPKEVRDLGGFPGIVLETLQTSKDQVRSQCLRRGFLSPTVRKGGTAPQLLVSMPEVWGDEVESALKITKGQATKR